jgi:regulator of replication initiation timing
MADKPDEVQDALDNVEHMNTLYNEIYSVFQSKTARLKKQVTHWMGKFMVVKMENNKLRAVNRKIVKLNMELQVAMGHMDNEITELKDKIADLKEIVRDTVPV